jgi:hypothetical protein
MLAGQSGNIEAQRQDAVDPDESEDLAGVGIKHDKTVSV